ncbi:hypothetical protein IMSAGC011_01712 [Lachnospiraceae bacterium]|nr:hypothetical protein IMSAGC011_01712 [Lachnospiraceae bacterium]
MREREENDRVLFGLAALIGSIAFILIYGVSVLNPVYDDWLLGQGDLTQHYLGWCFYRRAEWTFPIGLTNNLAYPSYTSVIFTDSIPLLAVFFKILSPLLPEPFQYFGWWGILSFALQGYFSAKILREFSLGKIETLIGSIFFVVSPIVIERMFRHTALGGHWLILMAIYLFVRHRKDYQNWKKTTFYWGGIGALIAAIHLYFLPMCGAFLCGYFLCSFLRDKSIRLNRFLPGVSFAGAIVLVTYLLGGFSTRATPSADGLGECSFNLNGFFNEKGYSRFFDALPMYYESQYEGFAYLGLGVFILATIAVIFILIETIRKRGRWLQNYYAEVLSGILIAIGLILFAASPTVTWNNKLLFVLTDSSTLTNYWSIFRATGRIIWPVCYLIYIIVIVCNGKLWGTVIQKNNRMSIVPVFVLAFCCFLQLFDINKKLEGQKKWLEGNSTYISSLQDEVWELLTNQETLAHFVWVSNNFENRQILEMAKWAYDNMLTMNIFYFARGISVIEDTQYSLQHPDDTYVFVFTQEEIAEYLDCGLNFYEAGTYIVGTTFMLNHERYE